ncbi:hypothetical protein WA026_019724 [Henosepilachna vigintioctopunctata]|uniref:Centrobin n=1 Tax=Henosepilachna vigintioctopunctata TaxID=420089 RepID=A0AAW1UQU8_9CUCU
MSESDDTDELLLMPPHIDDNQLLDNHFTPYYQIVDKLISQVSKLKSRITSIENSSDVSLGSITSSIDTYLNMRSSDSSNTCRRCYSYESLPQNSEQGKYTTQCMSTQSTPQKPRSNLMLKSFPNSPKHEEDTKRFRKPLYRTTVVTDQFQERNVVNEPEFSRPPVNIIREIDDFLSNVKSPAKPEAVRNLNFDNVKSEFSERQNRTLTNVQQILKEMGEQEERNNAILERKSDKTSSDDDIKNEEPKNSIDWKNGIETVSMTSTDSSLTDKTTVLYQPAYTKHKTVKESTNHRTGQDCGNRSSLVTQPFQYNSENATKYSINYQNSDRNSVDRDQTVIENLNAISNSARKEVSTPQIDIHSNAKEMLIMHKKLLDETQSHTDLNNYPLPTKKVVGQVNDSNLGAVSLVNLWNSADMETERNEEKCIQKLQEEKLRRTHCEELIQQLQNKILEQQEKLAVAIQVDEAKDTAIIRFHDAWEKVNMKFKLVVKERDQLENDIQKLVAQNEKITQDFEERFKFHKREADQALRIVQENQNKYEELERKYKQLSVDNETLKSTSQELEGRLKNEEEKNKQLSSILANKEIELAESKNILLHAKQEVSQCQAAVEMCQKDFTSIKAEYDLIQDEIKIERQTVSQLHQQNKALLDELEAQKKNEKVLSTSLKESQAKIENNKKELRNFYQGQVELLVQTKLKEFQKQLDDAEQKMKEELTKKETEIAKSAAMHIQQLNEKYTLEIHLLEQKHQEEMQLKDVRTAHMEQRVRDLENKLERQLDRKEDLMKQLRRVMEAQWAEAMRIINTGRSPVPPDDSSSTIDKLQSLHSKSYHNMEALLNREYDDKATNQPPMHRDSEVQCYDPQVEKRVNYKHCDAAGRRSSKSKSGKPPDSANLQRYIDLLLHKQPGNVLQSRERSTSPKGLTGHPHSDKLMWQYADSSKRKPNSQEGGSQRDENKKKSNWR